MLEKLKEYTVRKKVNSDNRKRLLNTDFSIIASNCNGCTICHDLKVKFNSPFVNLWIKPADFIKMLKNLKEYMQADLEFIKDTDVEYPVARLIDINIYFQHYQSEQEALQKWYTRRERINYDNLFVMFTDRDGCTYNDLIEFDKLPYNKVVFTYKSYPEILCSYYIKGFENDGEVGACSSYTGVLSNKKYYDYFDYVSWFNGN